MEGATLNALDVQVLLVGVDLTTKGVTAHHHVERTERALVLTSIQDRRGEHDHARARAVDRQAGCDAVVERVKQSEGEQQVRHGGRLAARDDQAVDLVELRNPAHKQRAGAGVFQRPHVLCDVALQGENADGHHPRSARR